MVGRLALLIQVYRGYTQSYQSQEQAFAPGSHIDEMQGSEQSANSVSDHRKNYSL
jgi:transcription elongation factor